MSKGFASSYRIVLLATGLFACFAGLGTRLVWLQIIDREELLRSVTKARRQLIVEEARRGDILDTKGNILATSRSLIVLGVDPTMLRKEDEAKWPQLAALLGIPLPELRQTLTTKLPPAVAANPAPAASSAQPPAGGLVINFNLTPGSAGELAGTNPVASAGKGAEGASDQNETAPLPPKRPPLKQYVKLSDNVTEALYTQIEKLGIAGIVRDRAYRRAYPHGQLGAHVIGYVNSTEQPATGIERYADFYLRGQDGWRESERDGHRRELAQFRSREVPRADGYSVVLSLDCNVQDMIEQELVRIAQQFQPEKATIIVSDPRTGFILGMGNYPTFDLNEYGKVPAEAQASMKNIAITDILEPGSTFKIVSVAAGLDEGVIVPTDRFDCNADRADYKNRTLKLPKDEHHYDHDLNVAEIVAHSSNRGAAQIGMRLGEQRLYDYARAFGFGRPLGFPTGGEVAGLLAKPEKWSGIDITRIPMGHTISATALQMHQGMCTIATGGVLLRPQIIRQIKDASGEAVYRYERAEIGRAVSERTAKTMAQMLMGVASKEGTAPEAAIPNYEVAGKTGTTQMLLPEVDAKGNRSLQYSEKHHIGSFVGFFPASDPQVAITVVVHNADGRLPGGWGAKVAAPSFKRIGEQLISYLNIKAPPAPVTERPLFAAQAGNR
jgi:cell division protein FtsI (penicillin-binding protein 3)